MSTRSPKERLTKLFRKDAKKDEGHTSPPQPASPTSNGGRGHVRNMSSRASLRDMMHSGIGRSGSKAGRRVSSGASITPAQEPAPVRDSHPAAQAAAAKAMYPNEGVGNAGNVNGRASKVLPNAPPERDVPTDYAQESSYAREPSYDRESSYARQPSRLPSVPHESDLSTDLQHLTMSNAASQQATSNGSPYAGVNTRKAVSGRPTSQESSGLMARAGARGNVKPLVPGAQPHSEDVANWNIVQNQNPLGSQVRGAPAPLNVKKQNPADTRAQNYDLPVTPTSTHHRSLSRKADVNELRNASLPSHIPRSSVDAARGSSSIRRSSLQKPLPPAPSDEYAAEIDGERVIKKENDLPDVHSALGKERGYLVKDAEKPLDLTGIVDLRNTEDTTLHERWAPAVTHETIIQNVHEIREEQITREIHEHHVFHRVLPIVDIEVLPARHFVPVEGGYAEIAEEEVPGQTGVNAQWIIAETMSKLMPQSKGPVVPQHFTARKFEGKDGDYKEYMTPATATNPSFKRTEQWWVHPPTIETGGRDSGQTYAFHIGSPNPADDGLRAHLPVGQVIGVSPLLAKQQKERLRGQQGTMTRAVDDAPPPVPRHKLFPAEMVDASRSGHSRPNISHGFSYQT